MMNDPAGSSAEDLFIARSMAAHRVRQELFWYAGPEREEEVLMRPLISLMPARRVKAGDPEALKARGFKVGDCHRNCIAKSAADQSVRHVFGWTVHPDYYLMHSVLQTADGDYACITPDHTDQLDNDGRFEFMEDGQLACDGVSTYRAGEKIGPYWTIIRRDAAKIGTLCADLEARVRNGELSYEEAMGIWAR